MAYVEYVACDQCGNDLLIGTDMSYGITFARRYARKCGWQVGKAGWLCPKCRRKRNSPPKNEKKGQ